MSNKKVWVTLILVFFLAGAAGSFFYFRSYTQTDRPETPASLQNAPPGYEDLSALRIFYPVDNLLQMVEKKVPRRTKQASVAEAVIEEFFRGPGSGMASSVPQNVKLLGVYRDSSQVLYLDLSDELRRNFQGNALSEYLLLKGIYESLISNLQDLQDVKILIEGKEAETLGGHFYLKYALKNTVSYEFIGDKEIADE